jgi:hypothetical protein
MFNINCSTVGNQYECLLNCAAATPCAQLGFATIGACMAQCSGPADGGPNEAGPGFDAGPAGTCATCGTQKCGAQAFGCVQDTTCRGWLGCIGMCEQANAPPTCYETCDTMYASASALYSQVYTCTCASCGTECSFLNPCAAGMDGGP